MIKAVVGSGGKTSLIRRLAQEYRKQGKTVFVTTSTHMMIEEDTVLSDCPEEILSVLEDKGYVMAGIPIGEKIKSLSMETYLAICKKADVVLVEADGSKHMPIKFPSEKEPVIYENIDHIIVVCGLHGLKKKACEVSHRLELVKQCLHIEEDTIICPAHIQELVRKGYVKPLSERYSDKTIEIRVAHDQSLYQKALAKLIEADVDVSMIKEEWFREQPELFICGGGHVAYDLVKMASNLDFYIKVMDDRKEFANAERFYMADEVIYDTFENLEKYLPNNGYCVVLTRGHQSDFTCVHQILKKPYQYLGMIGSRKKVQATKERLYEVGVSEEQIQSLHAPIGLPIKAQTPAEIAVSILAEIIQEKNQKTTSFASRELLKTKESGTLCIIVEKHGSAPRGAGSMMFVGNDFVIDSIGGGSVEAVVIEEARKCNHVMLREYHVGNENSAALGMICGGTNKILFIPI